MTTNIGPKIGVDGEAEFRKQMSNINQQLKTLGSEMKVITSEFADNSESQEALTRTTKTLTDSISAQQSKVDLLTDMWQRSADALGENDTKTLKYKQQLNEATAQLNDMQAELKRSTEGIDALADEAEDSEGRFDGFKSAIDNVGSVLGTTGKTIAAGTAAIAAGVTAVGGAIVSMTSTAAQNADDINTMSKQYGMSVEDIQKYQFAAEQIDVSLDTLTGSMSKLTKNMSTASKGTGDAAAAFDALGIAIQDDDGTLRDRNEVFQETISALAKITDETQRDAYAMQIFGKSAQDLNPLILGGAEALREYGEQAESAGLILGSDALNTLNLVTDAMDTFKATISGSGNLFAVEFAEPIAGAIDMATEYIQRLTAAFSGGGYEALADTAGEIMLEILGIFNTSLPKVLQFGIDLVSKLIEGIVQMIPSVIDSGVDIIMTLIRTFIDLLPEIVDAAEKIIASLTLGISRALPELIPAATSAVLEIAETLIDNLDMLIDAGIELILALAKGLIDALPELIEKGPVIIEKLFAAIMKNLPKLIDAGIQLIYMLIDGLTEAIPTLIDMMPDIIINMLTVFLAELPRFLDAGIQVIVALGEGILRAVPEILTSVSKFGKDLFNKFKSSLGDFASLGRSLIDGLWDGISSAGSFLWGKIKDFGQDIVDGFKDVFQIHSPSRVFRDDIGKYLAQGIGVGFEREMQSVSQQMTRSIPTPEIAMNGAAAGMVNGLQTMMSGIGAMPSSMSITLKLENGQTIASWLLPDLRAAMKADPEVATA